MGSCLSAMAMAVLKVNVVQSLWHSWNKDVLQENAFWMTVLKLNSFLSFYLICYYFGPSGNIFDKICFLWKHFVLRILIFIIFSNLKYNYNTNYISLVKGLTQLLILCRMSFILCTVALCSSQPENPVTRPVCMYEIFFLYKQMEHLF